ncbi:hypothetical protein [Rhodoferax sp.]|uniref:hypothetical protein n=1 Tax=Rhodoferax sp. TaxID=50421 RepID=UPI0019FE80BB|nr:hypothetical protein [Rhodoferax sp.]
MHKLVVYGERTGAFRVKSAKDLAQSACLVNFLWDYRRESLEEALSDILARGKGWRARLTQGAARHCTKPIRSYPPACAW